MFLCSFSWIQLIENEIFDSDRMSEVSWLKDSKHIFYIFTIIWQVDFRRIVHNFKFVDTYVSWGDIKNNQPIFNKFRGNQNPRIIDLLRKNWKFQNFWRITCTFSRKYFTEISIYKIRFWLLQILRYGKNQFNQMKIDWIFLMSCFDDKFRNSIIEVTVWSMNRLELNKIMIQFHHQRIN